MRSSTRPAPRTLHRIVLFADYPAEPEGRSLFARLLRHELDHARQWEARGDAAFLLSKLIDDIHYKRFADAPEEKYLYRAKPDEQDANGSAATSLAWRFGDAPASHVHTDRWSPLVWSYKAVEPMETLIVRSVCFLFQYSLLQYLDQKSAWPRADAPASLDLIPRLASLNSRCS